MEEGDKKINIEIWWLNNSTLCSFAISSNFGDETNDIRTPDCT
jgi:hypothetical protein